jgi:hypothetical protein
VTRAERFGVAALTFFLASILTVVAAFAILTSTVEFAKGDSNVFCGTAWQVLFDEPTAQGESPPTTWPEPCQSAAHELWLQARPSAGASGVFAVTALCMWWGRRRSPKREPRGTGSIGGSKPEVK